MAYPFGGHPSFARMKERLLQLGCSIEKVEGTIIFQGRPIEILFILNPENGRFLPLPNMSDEERLAPSLVEHIERRLGVVTGFATKPH